MSLVQLNSVKTAEHFSNRQLSVSASERNSSDISNTELTEKFESESTGSTFKNIIKTSAQYNNNAPVVKSDISRKTQSEIINYTDLSEKVLNESSTGSSAPAKANIEFSLITKDIIGRGFYLTVPKTDFKTSAGKISRNYKPEKSYSNFQNNKGQLVNLIY